MPVTPTQEVILNQIINLFSKFPVLVLQGDSHSGKHYIVKKFFRRKKITPIEFKIQDLCKYTNKRITSQDLVLYLESLISSNGDSSNISSNIPSNMSSNIPSNNPSSANLNVNLNVNLNTNPSSRDSIYKT